MRELPPTAGLPLRWRDLLTGGPTRFAQDVAEFLGLPELLVTSSGSAALVIALATLREASPERKKVVVPAFTCPLVALAIRQAGLAVVPCDLVPGGLDMDPAALRRHCDPETLAVLPTHLAGRVADVAPALAAARSAGAFVIEDAAQALGATAAGGPVGSQGDIGFYSLAAGKGLTLFEGGLLTARDSALRRALARHAARLLPVAWPMELRRAAQLVGYAALYRPGLLAFAYGRRVRRALRRGDILGAAGDRFASTIPLHAVGGWRQRAGSAALRRLPRFLAVQATQAARRRAVLAAVPGVHIFADRPGERGTWPVLLLRLPDGVARDAVLDRLWGAGLGLSPLFVRALPDHPDLAGCVPMAEVPAARDLAARSLCLGNSSWLTEAELGRVRDVLLGATSAS